MVNYLVGTPDGSVGIVDGWERDEHARLQTLIVAQGWFGRRRFQIPLEKLIEIDHEHRRIVLARGAAPLEPKGPLQRLVARFSASRTKTDKERSGALRVRLER